MRPVLTKRDFVRRYKAGEFGNAAPTWDTLEQFLASNYTGLIHIRNRVAGGPTWYDVPHTKLQTKWSSVTAKHPADSLYLSGMAPTKDTTFQGEVRRSVDHLFLTYSTVPNKPMRAALAISTQSACGTIAGQLLRYYLNTKSYEWLWHLLDTYDDHIVEFSCYGGTHWGTVPGHNTVFWEVRKY